MGKRGPKKKLNLIRKWWMMHYLTIEQLDRIVAECKEQLPLLSMKFDARLVIAALVARECRRVDDDLFNANDFIESFKLKDEYEEDEEEVAEAPTAR